MVKERCEEPGDTKWRVSLMMLTMLMMLMATIWQGRPQGGIVPGIEPWQNCFKGVVHCEVSCDWQFQLPRPCYSKRDF